MIKILLKNILPSSTDRFYWETGISQQLKNLISLTRSISSKMESTLSCPHFGKAFSHIQVPRTYSHQLINKNCLGSYISTL